MTAPRRRHRDDEVRRRLLLSLAVAVLLHAGLFAALVHWTRVRPTPPRAEQPFMQLRLIDAPKVAAPETVSDVTPVRRAAPVPGNNAPTRIAPIPSTRPRVARPAAPAAVDSTEVAETGPTPSLASSVVSSADARVTTPAVDASTLHLFHRDGSIDLPDTDHAGNDPAAFGPRKRMAPYSPDPMVHRSPLPYAPTKFEGMWAPRDESLLGEWVRNATRSKSWDTQGGTRISCSAFLFFGGCGWGPAPRVSIEELKRMRADPPMPRPAPLLPLPVN